MAKQKTEVVLRCPVCGYIYEYGIPKFITIKCPNGHGELKRSFKKV